MGFAWPIVYMRARRLYDSPRRPYQLKYFHGDSPAALCAACAAPYLDRNAGSNVHSWRYSAIFHTTRVRGRSERMDGYFSGKWKSSKIAGDIFFFSFFFFFSLREDRYWMKRVDACSVEGGCRIWLVSKRNFIIVLQGLRVLDDWAFEIVWNFYS